MLLHQYKVAIAGDESMHSQDVIYIINIVYWHACVIIIISNKLHAGIQKQKRTVLSA